MSNIKKFLDQIGVTHLWNKVEENFPNNEELAIIVNAIDETKADKIYVDTKIADLVNSAPEALDTLGELATAFQENKEVTDV